MNFGSTWSLRTRCHKLVHLILEQLFQYWRRAFYFVIIKVITCRHRWRCLYPSNDTGFSFFLTGEGVIFFSLILFDCYDSWNNIFFTNVTINCYVLFVPTDKVHKIPEEVICNISNYSDKKNCNTHTQNCLYNQQSY